MGVGGRGLAGIYEADWRAPCSPNPNRPPPPSHTLHLHPSPPLCPQHTSAPLLWYTADRLAGARPMQLSGATHLQIRLGQTDMLGGGTSSQITQEIRA